MAKITQSVTFNFTLSGFNDVYVPLILKENRYVILFGGAGSGKSVFAGQKLLLRSLKETGHKFLLIRKVARTIRGSQFSSKTALSSKPLTKIINL